MEDHIDTLVSMDLAKSITNPESYFLLFNKYSFKKSHMYVLYSLSTGNRYINGARPNSFYGKFSSFLLQDQMNT